MMRSATIATRRPETAAAARVSASFVAMARSSLTRSATVATETLRQKTFPVEDDRTPISVGTVAWTAGSTVAMERLPAKKCAIPASL
jgi:hypothetical protein